MKHNRRPEVERLQDSVSYVPDAKAIEKTKTPNRSRYFDEFFAHMFIEDVKLGIMPIGGRSSKKQFEILLKPPGSGAAQIVESALSPGEYHHGLAAEVCDFVSQCALELLLFDRLTYEIVYLSDPKSAKLVGFEFVHINPFTLIQEGNNLVQVLPGDLATKLGKPSHIRLEPERVFIIKLPANFQSKMEQLLESLAALSSPITPDFFMSELASGTRKTPYDVRTHNHTRNVALASSTKLFGWNARLLFQDEALEYYLIHRSLLFERFKIELRKSILVSLNEGIKRAGSRLGFTAEIVVTGVPTIVDLQAARDHLQEGDASFAEILEPFHGF